MWSQAEAQHEAPWTITKLFYLINSASVQTAGVRFSGGIVAGNSGVPSAGFSPCISHLAIHLKYLGGSIYVVRAT